MRWRRSAASGVQAVEALVAERRARRAVPRPRSISRERVDPRILNKRALENLARAGAFDALHRNRAELLPGIEAVAALRRRLAAQDDRGGQVEPVRRDAAAAVPAPRAAEVEAWPAAGAARRRSWRRSASTSRATRSTATWSSARAARRRPCGRAQREGAKRRRGGRGRRRGARQAGAARRSGERFAFVSFSDPTGASTR